MKKITGLFFAMLSFTLLHAQYKVKFILKEKTAIQHDNIYVTGSFSNWDSTLNRNYILKREAGNNHVITLNLPAGGIKYKFHRGSWFTVEKKYNGDEVPDRVIPIAKDTTLVDSVESWRDELISDKLVSIKQQTADTGSIRVLAAIASIYAYQIEVYNSDSALAYAQKGLKLQQRVTESGIYKNWSNNYLFGLQDLLASLLHSLGNYPKSLEIRFENLKLAEGKQDKLMMARTLNAVAADYYAMKDYPNALQYSMLADTVFSALKDDEQDFRSQLWNKIGTAINYLNLKKFDSTLYYLAQIPAILKKTNFKFFRIYTNTVYGHIYSMMDNKDSALYYYQDALAFARKTQDNIGDAAAGLAKLFQKENKIDSALFYALAALNFYETNTLNIRTWGETSSFYIADLCPLLAELYRSKGNTDSAYFFLLRSVVLKDSLYNSSKTSQFQAITFIESSRKQKAEQQAIEGKRQYETKVKMIALIAGMAAILVVAVVLYRNNKHKQKANTLLQSQKQEIEQTLGELKNTQKQLVQSEKMASLGELTAGIAHEIQNPLNFVNNFSDINRELLDELKNEADKGNIAEVKAIADDVINNSEKINHHGKRADAIVKGMLQHSRATSGQKEATDINALCDEYVRLSYHGLRAKDKSFNATITTDFDNSMGRINIVPQDIGRVILNLLTNAFYAVNEKKKQQLINYEPTISISTKKVADKILIKVKDNGNGIPKAIADKIFQPFFTTKPTGQGTGLGLSLSYDIIKAHVGEIKMETKEGDGTTFIIQLPFN